MAVKKTRKNSIYGFPTPIAIFPVEPIVQRRDPTQADQEEVGTWWINQATNAIFMLTNIRGDSTWINIAGAGGAGEFTSLLVTGAAEIDGNLDVGGNATFNIAEVTNLLQVAGVINAADYEGILGNINIGIAIEIADINLGTDGTKTIEIGNENAGSSLLLQTPDDTFVSADKGLEVPTGIQVGATNATQSLSLAGNIAVLTGAGAPDAAAAVSIGDIYINTTAASAVTRLYIATAVGTWTNITCAA